MPGPERGPEGPEGPAARRPSRPAGVSVIVGGLLQDLEDRLRRGLAPIEERVRPGHETRGAAGGSGAGGAAAGPGLVDDPLVIVIPSAPTEGPVGGEPDVPDGDRPGR